MRARIHDSRAPRLVRWLSFVPALATFVTSLVTGSGRLCLFAIALLAITPVVVSALMRLTPKKAALELGAGEIKIRRPWMPVEKITGKQLVGASTAQLGGGVALSLDTSEEPVTLELESEADADAVRQALGAGHDGFGQVQWFARPHHARLIGLFSVAVCAASFAFAREWPILILAGMVSFMLGPTALLVSLPVLPPRLVLRQEGVAVFRQSASSAATPSSFHPWNQIHHAEERKGKLVIVLVTGAEVHIDRRSWVIDWRGMTRAQRSHIVAQITSAARRARGRGKPRPTVAEELEQLAASTVDTRGWLARVEAAAERMRADIGYYRGSAIAGEDLWSALENHDAPARVRATAARLLARVETDSISRERIERAVGSVREEETQHRIRIAIGDDLERAAQELEAIEAAEAARERLVIAPRVYRR